MGKYIGLYRNDFGKLTLFVNIEVRLEIDGVLQQSDYNFEEPYLSPTWRDTNKRPDEKVRIGGESTFLKPLCSTVEGMRYLRACIADKMFLIIPINFRGDSDLFQKMLSEFNQNRQILYSELIGERINTFWTGVFANK